MKINLKIVVLCTLLILSYGIYAFTQATGQPEGGTGASWVLLGTTEAKYTSDHDAIIIVGPYDHFRKLKFKVDGAPITLKRLRILYDDGGLPETAEGSYHIDQGAESRVLKLKGAKRNLKTIEFFYDAGELKNWNAVVSLYGMK
jgi:hypothetical protein